MQFEGEVQPCPHSWHAPEEPDPTPEIKYLSPRDMIDEGFLQEANRQFFHPLGLALEIYDDSRAPRALLRVWDYRDDPEGILFAKMDVEKAKAKTDRVRDQYRRIRDGRIRKTGWIIQPVEEMGMDVPLDVESDGTA